MISFYTLVNLFHHSFIQIEKLLNFKKLLFKWGIKHNEEWLLHESASSSGHSNRWWSPINLLFTSLQGIILKMQQHRRLYWSHHCRDDGIASTSHKDQPLWSSSCYSVNQFKYMNCSCKISAWEHEHLLGSLWLFKFGSSTELRRQQNCQMTRRWRKCCPTCHLTRKVGCFLLPGIPCTKKLLKLIRWQRIQTAKFLKFKQIYYKYKRTFSTILKNLVLPGCLFFLLCLPAFYLLLVASPLLVYNIFWDCLLSK